MRTYFVQPMFEVVGWRQSERTGGPEQVMPSPKSLTHGRDLANPEPSVPRRHDACHTQLVYMPT